MDRTFYINFEYEDDKVNWTIVQSFNDEDDERLAAGIADNYNQACRFVLSELPTLL